MREKGSSPGNILCASAQRIPAIRVFVLPSAEECLLLCFLEAGQSAFTAALSTKRFAYCGSEDDMRTGGAFVLMFR